MNTVFEEIYAEAFTDQLVKIAQDNNIDPDSFVNHVMEKQASAVGRMATKGMAFAKEQLSATGQSFKNMLDAGAGLGKGVKGSVAARVDKARGLQDHFYGSLDDASKGYAKMKSALPNAKRALAITGVGALGTGGAAYGLTR